MADWLSRFWGFRGLGRREVEARFGSEIDLALEILKLRLASSFREIERRMLELDLERSCSSILEFLGF